MPEPVSRSIGSGFASPAYPIIANNPAFKVEMIPLDNRMEQKNGAKPNNKEMGQVKVGDMVKVQISGEEKAKQVQGRVVAVDQEDETVLAFRVLTTNGEEVNLDPTTVAKVDIRPEDFSDPQNESWLNFSDWKKLNP
jgi:hypothetical protein